MSLTAGARIGPYEIVSALGAGGMGEVYRARDTRLQRDVAVKILPEAVAADPDRLARFQREAELLAALNHPHIAQVYGLEEGDPSTGAGQGGVRAIVMELVDGPTLADRLSGAGATPAGSTSGVGRASRGRGLPTEEAIGIARQIAEALEDAHEKGIVHRDLKPANVKLTPDGRVKVLDFGLAKALDQSGGQAAGSGYEAMNSPTLTTLAAEQGRGLTAQGIILGTAAYMAPEQARGRPVDRRADIWAFGVVLFEMLTGRPMFAGDTVSDTLAAVLRQDIDWTALPADTPAGVRQLLRRCLDRDPKRRLRDIGEARIALDGTAVGVDIAAPPRAARGRAFVWATVGLALALAATLVFAWRASRPAAPGAVVRFDVAAPEGGSISLATRPAVTVSPDGTTVAFVASEEGTSRLYVRRRDQATAAPIAGTEGATNPVFSPDGRSIAFFAGTALKKTTLDGQVLSLTTAPGDVRGICWLDASTLVYVPDAVVGLMMISAQGGEPKPLTTVDKVRDERTHRWPMTLPGGRAVLFTVGVGGSPDDYEDATIDAVVVATGERRTVFRGASYALPMPDGRLLLARGGLLRTVAFDPDTLTISGEPALAVRGVTGDRTTGAVHAAVAGDGTLVYIPGDAQADAARRVVWVNPDGTLERLPGLPDDVHNDVRVSPDGSRVAVVVGSSGSGDVWIYDLARTTFTRLTFTGTNLTPVWSRDGRFVYYLSFERQTGNGRSDTVVYRRPADGSREAERVASIDQRSFLHEVRADGLILDSYTGGPSITDIVHVPFDAEAKPATLVGTTFDEYSSALSPDGRWLAYQSNESGRYEIYVRDLEPSGGRWQISTGLGEEPHWAPDGRTLYYRADEELMAVPVDTRNGFVAGTAAVRLKGIYNLRSDSGISFDVDPATGRLLMIRPAVDRRSPATVRVVFNWLEELKARLANP